MQRLLDGITELTIRQSHAIMQHDGADALEVIAKAAAAGRVSFSDHAVDESMLDDGVFEGDVVHVLANGTDAIVQNDAETKWKVYGPILDGSEYAVVVVLIVGGALFVVTTHPPP